MGSMRGMKRLGVVLMIAVALLAGCRSERRMMTPSLIRPKATSVDVRLTEQTMQGASFTITLMIANPNDIELPLREARYTLDVAGMGPVAARDTVSRSLPPKDQQAVQLKVAMPRTGEMAGAVYEVQGTISYEPPGEIRRLMTESYVPLPTLGFEAKGRL